MVCGSIIILIIIRSILVGVVVRTAGITIGAARGVVGVTLAVGSVTGHDDYRKL